MIKLESWNGSRKGMQVMWGMLNSMTFRGLWAFSSPSPSHCRLLYVGCLKWVAKRSALYVSCWMQRKKDLINPAWPVAQHLSIHFTSFIAYSYSGSWGLQPFTIQRTHTQSHTHTWSLFKPVFMMLHLGENWRRNLRETPLEDVNTTQKDGTEKH